MHVRVKADSDAVYDATFTIDLAQVPQMVATPGDPRNGISVDKADKSVVVEIAYGGSCTGGKMADMDMYADVLKRGLDPLVALGTVRAVVGADVHGLRVHLVGDRRHHLDRITSPHDEPATQLFVEKVEQRYSIGVVAATLLVFLVPLLVTGDLPGALLRAMTLPGAATKASPTAIR